VGQAFFNQLIKSNTINKKRSIYSVLQFGVDISVFEFDSVYSVPLNWVFVLWFQNYTRNVEMLGISESFVYPGF